MLISDTLPKGEVIIIKANNYYTVRELHALSCNFHNNSVSKLPYFSAHFKDEEVKVERGQVNFPRLPR